MLKYYLLAILFGLIGGIGILNEELNRVTSGIRIFGVLTICLRVLIIHNSVLNVLGIVLISIIGAFISFVIAAKIKA